MPQPRHPRLISLLSRAGLLVTPLGPGAALVSSPRRRLTVQALDNRTWVVQRRGRRRRRVLRLGPADLRTHLVVDEKAVLRRPPLHHKKLEHRMSREHLAWVLRELDVNCVLDVGANVGQFGSSLRGAGYTGRIVSFEPLPHLAEQLHVLADEDPEWHVMQYALGDQESEAEMTVVAGQGKTSSLLPASDFGRNWSPRLQGVRKETVQVRRLENVFDDVVAGLEQPRVFLKMDTQGYDVRAFDGAGPRIKEVLGLQSEVSTVPLYDGMPRMPEALATYEAAGFETTGIFPVTKDKERLRMIELDLVMIRPEALGPD